MTKPWFDPQTGDMLFSRYVVEMDSFRAITEDVVITDAELATQTEKVAGLLKQLESELPDSTRALATEALCELAVLNALLFKRFDQADTGMEFQSAG